MSMKGKIKIHTELCKGCMYCIDACPAGVISIRKRFNKSGYFAACAEHMEKCTGCAMCAHVCPEIAIEVYRDNGKK
jgi:2-oxoglutarate ferredoxin oxidoreductase subunit delta